MPTGVSGVAVRSRARKPKAERSTVRVGVIGCGEWGKHLVREMALAASAELVACCDAQAGRLDWIRRSYPQTRVFPGAESVLRDPSIEAVVIATPAVTHAALVQEALAAGKHVFVEKPIALSVSDAQACIAAARKAGRKLMVGHLLLYHPAFRMLKTLTDSGALGQVLYLYTQRLNLGRIRTDENALWSLAPHDISMILQLIGQMPVSVSARGAGYIQDSIEDVVFMILQFPDGKLGHIHLSWLDPHKIRKITVVGSQKMVTFDDMEPTEKIRIYDKGAMREYDSYGDWWITMRSGDVHIPKVDLTEPLRLECQHFLDCVLKDQEPLSNGDNGLQVLRVLDGAQRSLEQKGAWIQL